MDFLKEGLNKIKGLNIEIDVRTSDKLEYEACDTFVDVYFAGRLTFRIYKDSVVTVWENVNVTAGGNASVEAWENASVEAWENARVTLKNM